MRERSPASAPSEAALASGLPSYLRLVMPAFFSSRNAIRKPELSGLLLPGQSSRLELTTSAPGASGVCCWSHLLTRGGRGDWQGGGDSWRHACHSGPWSGVREGLPPAR